MKYFTDVPAQHEMMCELFQAMKELGGSGSLHEIDEKTIELLNISPEILEVKHSSSNKTEIEYRLAWTRSYLKKVGILENSLRGVWSLTAKGQELEEIDPVEIVLQVRKMLRLKKQPDPEYPEQEEIENEGLAVPDEIQDWRDQLKNLLFQLKPDAFERLTQRILRESGFVQVKVTGKTGDGGVDGTGIIKLNGMISFHMIFQCKRYTGTVPSKEIRDFRGAMQGRADKGLFITTGRFSSSAIQEANRPGTTPIDLMDGDDLVEKLKELQLGVLPVTDYIIDESWFLSI
ncbi:restriction endonuclease [Massilioclostridium coli]|uniref:restriction endonuclease n=1 Tax=Massilioclostridium coli TaxID=1870991 RepID=UPI00085C8A0C|nr:restriction endonuclease [Massilioclostridium coli]PWM98182.1 MAG: restriction endonuclease [Massilioclostridium sp.]PWN00695.1 MAG: restriction endonuclease [Massilioclostridium sp.]